MGYNPTKELHEDIKPALCSAAFVAHSPASSRVTTQDAVTPTRNMPTCPAVALAKVEFTVPSLDDWEKDWQDNPQRSVQPKLLPVNFRSPLADPDWLNDATKTIGQYLRRKNARRNGLTTEEQADAAVVVR